MANNQNSPAPKKNVTTTIALIAVACVVLWLNQKYQWHLFDNMPAQTQQTTDDTSSPVQTATPDDTPAVQPSTPTQATTLVDGVCIPSSVGDNQIVQHMAFMLSYNDECEQADWVFYKLTKDMVTGETNRSNDFREDPLVTRKSAVTEDYTRSGYTRGHLCPCADIRTSDEAQSETFYMSNMSPQLDEFNRGIWNDLEMQVRRWARKHDKVFVATGPVLSNRLKKIGRYNKISVPEQFYKIIYSPQSGGHMIAFLMPHKDCGTDDIYNYMATVDDIEQITGIDFFHNVKNEKRLESQMGDTDWWK